MAKILLGPLAASVSGSVGQLTFARTKFGQVIQGKPVPPYPGLPSQQLSIDRFRKANHAYWRIHDRPRWILRQMADHRNEVQTSAWVRAFIRWMGGLIWNLPRALDLFVPFEVQAVHYDATTWHVHTNLDADPWAYAAIIIAIKDGAIWSKWNGNSGVFLSDPPSTNWLMGLTHPFSILAISVTYFDEDYQTFGFNDLKESS